MPDFRPLFSPFGLLQASSMKFLSKYLQGMVRGRLWLKVLIGMFLGLVTGVLLGPTVGLVEPGTAATLGNWLAFPGHLFLASIQMIVIPLVVASVIRGLAASEDVEQLKAMGLRVAVFFVLTTALATAIGLTTASLIRPGESFDPEMVQSALGQNAGVGTPRESMAPPSLAELPEKLIALVPGNPLSSMVQADMLQIVIFALVVGIALVNMKPSRAKPLLDLMSSLQEVCMTVVKWAMYLAPLAVFGLLAQLTTKIGFDALVGMALYVATVLLGLAVLFLFYMLLVALLTALTPWQFIRSVREVLLLAFSTSSSAAVMPLSIKTAEERLGVRSSVAQFVIPLGATINMNGTALYQGVAAVFLAQTFGVDLSYADMVLIVAMAVGASIGSPATPGVGIIILAMVLTTVGIPEAGIALIMGVDRILDMSRTAINVAGDLVTCRLVDRWVVPAAERPEAQAPATDSSS